MSGASRWSHKTQNRIKKKLSVQREEEKENNKTVLSAKGRIT